MPADPPTPISDVQFEDAIRNWALIISRERKASALVYLPALDYLVSSTQQERDEDWRNASILNATSVLLGDLRLTDLKPECFWRLENVWLDEVKQILAYFNWIDKREQEQFWSHASARAQHYWQACDRIRDLLADRKVKERLDRFFVVRDYIKRYLDEYSHFQPESSSYATELLEAKVSRLYPKTARQPAEAIAREYCRMFYENIIPAVESADEEPCVTVLQSLQYGGVRLPDYPSITNSFEASVAVAFLDAKSIAAFWRSAERVSKDTTF
ncbi:MAG TPA: hypothetical protein VFA33_22260 [Bryobacteraceae bacterium]|nr:hypothetical protein [Bryobacteraceae bacterium]